MVRISSQTAIKKMSGGGLSQQFCVRWNSHLGSLGAAFPQLLAGQRFVDVTLACEGHQVHCHRLVLAACSSYFESLLGENPCKHPIIILPRDIKLWEIQALVDFMYKGEVNVSQAGLPDLLKCAEALQIRGLCGSDAALNLNQISTNTSNLNTNTTQPTTTTQQQQPNNSIKNNFSNNLLSSTPKLLQSTSTNSVNPNAGSSSTSTSSSSQLVTNNMPKRSTSPIKSPPPSSIAIQENLSLTDDLRNEMRNNDTQSPMVIQPPIEPTIGLEEGEDSVNGSNSEMNDESDLKMHFEFEDSNNIKLEPDEEQLFHQQLYQLNHQQTSHFGKIRVKSNENLFENYKNQRNHYPSSYNLNTKQNFNNKNISESLTTTTSLPPSPTTITTTEPQSSNNFIYGIENNENTQILPSSLRFNKNSMQIFVTKKPNELNQENIEQSASHINIKQKQKQQTDTLSENSFENIICSPNLMPMSYNEENDINNSTCDQYQELQNNYSDINFDSGLADASYEISYPDYVNNDGSTQLKPYGNKKKPTNIYLPPLIPFDGSKKQKDLLKEEREKKAKLTFEDCLLKGGPPPECFFLRNPRGNQPRTYNIQALWSALVDVKAGESIYRASQIHKVPRKTLRNWMKRWGIKSAYPMPRQLRQAAEKRKTTNADSLTV